MKELKFDRIGETDYFNLFLDGKLICKEMTLDEVLACISEKEKESEVNK